MLMLEKLRNLLPDRKNGSIDEKVPLVIIKLEEALNRLDRVNEGLIKEDQSLFQKCIEARMNNDYVHAKMYANECAEIRKISLLLVSSQYAVEQMVLRLKTVMKLSDLLVTVSPVMEVIKETGNRLVGFVPSVSGSLNEANTILDRCLTNMGTSPINGVRQVTCSEGALKVLDDAENIAMRITKEKFPDIPEVNPPNAEEELLKE